MATVLERIKKVTVEQLGVEEADVTLEASYTEDLGADSLDLVELIMAFEEEFSTDANKIEIPDDDAKKIKTVKDTVAYINEKGIKD